MADNKGFFGSFLDKFKFSDEKEEERVQTNQIATDNEDGAVEVSGRDFYSGFGINLDWGDNSQSDMINMYREISNYSTVDYAIQDIVNEMISFDEDEEPVKLDLSKIEDDELSENIRKIMYEKWDKISKKLELKNTIHRRARQFYIDGRLAYQKVVDSKKPTDGILDIIELDAKYVTKIREKEFQQNSRLIRRIKEYYIYDDGKGQTQKNTEKSQETKMALAMDSNILTYVTSGLTDLKTGYAISWLHKAVVPANKLRMMENALVIYRITRAPERRMFYVDVAGLPSKRADAYVRNLRNTYRNKMSFDPESGLFKDQRHLMTMQEDYWLPRSSNGRGTEVSTLAGGQNLSEIDDVIYFQKQLYKALNVPISRLESESMMPLGRTAEISRDELKFSKFVSNIRKRFNMMFYDLLKTELILTKVMTAQEWEEIKEKIDFRYAKDMYLEEIRNSEILRDRLDLLEAIKDYAGIYFSHKYIRENILKQSEQEIEDEDEQIKDEQTDPRFANPLPDSEDGEMSGYTPPPLPSPVPPTDQQPEE